MIPRMRRDPRPLVFLVIAVALAGVSFGYAIWRRSQAVEPAAVTRTQPPPAAGPAAVTETQQPPAANPEGVARLEAQPHILFRNSDLGTDHGRVVVAAVNQPDPDRYVTPMACERVHFANGRGVCLVAERGLTTTYRAVTVGPDFKELHQFPLPGIPSRVRVSPSGRLAGITVFVSGDSYAGGSFSTRALVLDTMTGDVLGDLEQYAVTRDGTAFKAIDFNFWGITFADDRRFYATLQTGGRRYLVEGDVTTRTATVVGEDVECPALSPDGTRVAYKKREIVDGRLVWRMAVRDLATGRITLLSETRSVDDQPEWLDDRRVLYGLPTETRPGSAAVWVASADGSGQPALFLDSAWSPAVVREAGAATTP